MYEDEKELFNKNLTGGHFVAEFNVSEEFDTAEGISLKIAMGDYSVIEKNISRFSIPKQEVLCALLGKVKKSNDEKRLLTKLEERLLKVRFFTKRGISEIEHFIEEQKEKNVVILEEQ